MADQAKTDEEILKDISKELEEYIDWLVKHDEKTVQKRKNTLEDGMICKKCCNFFPFAVANQADDTMICYSCKNYG